jgi:secreted trypsin-like serine protease
MCQKQLRKGTIENAPDLQKAYNRLFRQQQQLGDLLAEVMTTIMPTRKKGTLQAFHMALAPIINGIRTPDFPECCLVGTILADQSIDWHCTGVLIAKDMVLTAAHCIENGFAYAVAVNKDDVNLVQKDDIINVRRAERHPMYRDPVFMSDHASPNDIAILKLQQAVNISPATLISKNELRQANEVTIVGFGKTDTAATVGFGIKRMVTTNILSLRRSDNQDMTMEVAQYGHDSDLAFVAGNNNRSSGACKGDSGGPVYVDTGNGLKLAGLTSSSGWHDVMICGENTICTRIDTQEQFIRSMLS